MAPHLRLAKASQIPTIRALLFEAFTPIADRMNKTLPADGWSNLDNMFELRNLYALHDGDTLLGGVSLIEEDNALYVDALAIYPAFQKKGLGKQIMQEVEMIAESRELPRLRLTTPEVMHELLAFYIDLGFSEVKRALPEDGRDDFYRVHFEKAVANNGLGMDPLDEHDRELH